MAKYQMHFNTQSGWKPFNVHVDEDETLKAVLQDILGEMEQNGFILKGHEEGQGEVYVTWGGQALDLSKSLPSQGVKPNDILRVEVGVEESSIQLRRDGEMFDVVSRVELIADDEILVGKTLLRFHVGKQKQKMKQTTFVERLQQGRSFKQTVYYMALVGGFAGLGCWFLAPLLVFVLNVSGEWIDLINFPLLGGFIGGLSVSFNDKWLGDRVVGKWVLTGALVGALAGVVGGLLALPINPTLGKQFPLLARALLWMITGALIGFSISLRWFSVNKNRVLHGLIGGLFGGLLGGIVYWSLGTVTGGDVSQALGFILTGVGITCGISIAPILLRRAALEFVTSGDHHVVAKYARSHKQWEIHQGGKYIIGSLSAAHTHTMFGPEVQVFIPDQLVAERHAVLLSKSGKYYIEPHPALAYSYNSAPSPGLGGK